MVCLILGVREKVGDGFEKTKNTKKGFEWSLLIICIYYYCMHTLRAIFVLF